MIAPLQYYISIFARLFCLYCIYAFLSTGSARAQGERRSTEPSLHRANVHVEPLAVGIDAGKGLSDFLTLGVDLTVGPSEAVDLQSLGNQSGVDLYSSVYIMLRLNISPHFQLMLEPLGAAFVVGNDWSQTYPSASLGVQVVSRRIRLASMIRVVRVAGGFGSGDYWVTWVPLRIGYRL